MILAVMHDNVKDKVKDTPKVKPKTHLSRNMDPGKLKCICRVLL